MLSYGAGLGWEPGGLVYVASVLLLGLVGIGHVQGGLITICLVGALWEVLSHG